LKVKKIAENISLALLSETVKKLPILQTLTKIWLRKEIWS